MGMIQWLSSRKIRNVLCGLLFLHRVLGSTLHLAERNAHLLDSSNDETDKAAKSGPHGTLIAPTGGKTIRSVEGQGIITVKFKKYIGNEGQTIGVDFELRPVDGNRTTYLLGNGLTSGRANPEIDVQFSSRYACGTYNLVVREHQFYKGVHISFRVAAPRIKITCLPIQK